MDEWTSHSRYRTLLYSFWSFERYSKRRRKDASQVEIHVHLRETMSAATYIPCLDVVDLWIPVTRPLQLHDVLAAHMKIKIPGTRAVVGHAFRHLCFAFSSLCQT
jgi:hypothetical protein